MPSVSEIGRRLARTAAALVGAEEWGRRADAAFQRRVTLEGARNFRDLGGYRTRDGRTLKWGRLFRSGALADLTERDLGTLARLDLALVCDLRAASERAANASRLPPQSPPAIAHVPIAFEPMDPELLRRRILGRRVETGEFAGRLRAAYRAYVTDFTPQFAEVVARVADAAPRPALVHCSEGKDRTGFAAALILLGLGVPLETVLEDYLLTNALTAAACRRTARLVFVASRFTIRPRETRALLEARPEYLEVALETIGERYGSVATYLREGLGIGNHVWQRLHAALLE